MEGMGKKKPRPRRSHIVTPPPASPLLPVHMPRYELAPTPQNSTTKAMR